MPEPDTTVPAEGDFIGDAQPDEADPAPGAVGPGARAEPDHQPHPAEQGSASV